MSVLAMPPIDFGAWWVHPDEPHVLRPHRFERDTVWRVAVRKSNTWTTPDAVMETVVLRGGRIRRNHAGRVGEAMIYAVDDATRLRAGEAVLTFSEWPESR